MVASVQSVTYRNRVRMELLWPGLTGWLMGLKLAAIPDFDSNGVGPMHVSTHPRLAAYF